MDFPQYRKYFNQKSYFKIQHEKHFEEVQLVGKQRIINEVHATQFPEMLRIQDMLACKDDVWQKIEEAEYLSVREP